ncbi:MAG TPA: hypothetical protein VGH87_16745, partial [Polyangiaceae bacterium]
MRFLKVSLAVLMLGLSACGESSGGGADSASAQNHELIGKPAPSFSVASAHGQGKADLAALKG